MTDDQYQKLMHAIALDIAVKISSPQIDRSKLRGAAIDAITILNQYEDWAKTIKKHLTGESLL